ncbi:MAG: hypothetical protein JSU88_00520 [Nitrospinaceae bacterium]|jgi:tetratricopeptide (TPR) repeat protein|nr:MAG: hypothetical protein JSU88_00520 [Nitrospinaceae bacterium]
MKLHRGLWALALFWVLLAGVFLGSPSFAEEAPDPEAYRAACLQGTTVYCIAIGLEEQKAGHNEQALEYYRLACRNHPGHLRACTPFLSLARDMGRLENEAAVLEGQCRSGDDVLCYYLGKEYLKIGEYGAGRGHLQRLCKADFIPPDADDYGPCYHLASSLQGTRDYERALEIFRFDCDRARPLSEPSCERYGTLTRQMAAGKDAAPESTRPLQLSEALLLPLILLPPLGFFFWLRPKERGLRFLRFPAPALALCSWLLWELVPPGPPAPRHDLFFILPSLLLVVILAIWAHFHPRP